MEEYLVLERDEICGRIEVHLLIKEGEDGERALEALLENPIWPVIILGSFRTLQEAKECAQKKTAEDSMAGIYHY